MQIRESDDCPARKEAWQKFMRERLEIRPGEEKYVASGFDLRSMWTAFAAGYSAGHEEKTKTNEVTI